METGVVVSFSYFNSSALLNLLRNKPVVRQSKACFVIDSSDRNGTVTRGVSLPIRASSSSNSSWCFFNPVRDDPVLKEAIKEPLAFLGGVFAGTMRLDLKEDPLKEWVLLTAEAAGLTKETDSRGSDPDEKAPRRIEIE